jgi:YqaJ-like viral recombinase domain
MHCISALFLCLCGIKAIQWGIQNEETALVTFQKLTSMHVEPIGLWPHHSRVTGASPDGLIKEKNAAVEVKCPYSARNISIAGACKNKNFCLRATDDDGHLIHHPDHAYDHQVQGQMHLTNTDLGYLVGYSTVEVAVVEIARDDSWTDNIPKPVDFYSSQNVTADD